jgi:phosphoglycerol transferase
MIKLNARAVRAYVAAAGISTVAAVFLLKLWQADLRVPFEYRGDALYHAMLVKSVVDHGWYLRNPSLGAPGVLALYDFPALDTFHLLVVKVMAWFSGDWALLFNLYFLLGFPLITLSAMAVFRHFRVSDGPAIVGSVLYSFLPSRLLKGEGHLFLDVFYQVPLVILVMLWVCGPDPPLVRDGTEKSRWPRLDLRSGRSLAALLICLVNASSSVYYSFFAAWLLAAGGIWASVERRTFRNAIAGVALAGVIGAGLVANNLPTFAYQLRHGPNADVGTRSSGEAEVYAMKIAQLLLPVQGHRLPRLRRITDEYCENAPLVGENSTTSLGLLGSAGFLVLLGWLLRTRAAPADAGDRPRAQLERSLMALNLMAVLLGTMGGFGALIATLITPLIRTYARMNVLIAFFALFVVALLLERLQNWRPRLAARVIPLALAFGLLDQTSPRIVLPYAATKQEYVTDDAFVRAIEASSPPNTAIFELPYLSFPEGAAVNETHQYDFIRPYLHARSLRWSFPTIRGRPGATWAREVAGEEPQRMVRELAGAGFGGILIDRNGFPERPPTLETALRAQLGAASLVSPNGRFVYFKINPPLGANR